MNNKKLAFSAAVSAFIAIIENLIPLPVPFLRLGLANIPIVLGFSQFKLLEIGYLLLVKVLFSHLLRGTFFSYPFFIALMGNLMFFLLAGPLLFLWRKKTISFLSISFLGALAHNCGQLLGAYFLLPSVVVLNLLPIFLILGSISGAINGIISNRLYKSFYLRLFMEEKLFKKTADYVQCLLCPNLCKITKEGEFGQCRIRQRVNEEIINPYAGILSAESLDPIEKKPLYHYHPGSEIFSIGFYGCTLSCQFCQNYNISQEKPPKNARKISPPEFVKYLEKQQIKQIAFTYSEPLLYYEWVKETARLCKEKSINTVLVTNGYLNKLPAKNLLPYIDAANIDLKSFSNDFYSYICGGKLEPVKEFIKLAFELNVHVELTTLVITATNDSLTEAKQIIDFISAISKDLPWHISRYHPCYNFDKPATAERIIKDWLNEAKGKLNYVYAGNVSFGSDTFCKNCHKNLIERNYYQTVNKNLTEEGKCNNCGDSNYFVM